MKTAFYWGMLGCGGAMLVLIALIPSARVKARPFPFAPVAEEVREEKHQSWSIPAAGLKALRISVKTGSLKVIAGQTNKVTIQAKRVVRAQNGTIARELLTNLPVSVERKGSEILINDVRSASELTGPLEKARVELELDITAPAGVNLEAAVAAGNTQLIGRIGKVALQTQVGNVTLERQQGINGEIFVGTGSVTLGGEVGNLAVQIRTGQVWASRLRANKAETLALSTGTGNIWMSLVTLPTQGINVGARTGDVVVKLPFKQELPGPMVLALTSLGAAHVDHDVALRPTAE